MTVLTALPVLALPTSTAWADTTSEPAPELTEGQKALAQAAETGDRVEVTGERSEYSTTFANPDGFSFTLEESAVPVRVATGSGGWTKPDPTLERRSDGSIGPKAAAVDMSFSGGGTDTGLAKISKQGRSLTLGWPGKLPKPELDGDSAVYADVLPDVDLRVTASLEGFRHVLVVKTAKAAESAALKRIDYSLKTNGITVREAAAAGGLAAQDANGNTVFRAPPAQMWDSAGEAATQAAGRKRVDRAAGAADESKAAARDEGVEPGRGDTVTEMKVTVSKGTLSVVPDEELLTDTDAAFPLYIDPTVTWSESERTLLRSDGYRNYGWGNGSDNLGKGVGECGTWNGYYCGPGYVQRLYFEFSPSNLKGKKVLDATFRVTEPWAFQCDPRWVDLVRTNNISSSTSWPGPNHLDLMVDRNVSAGRGSSCDPNSPPAPIEFNDNSEESNENLTPTVRNFAAGKFSRLTLMLKAHSESDTSAWKRFRNDAVLAVDFVGLPAKPSGIGLVAGSGTACETDVDDPAIVSDPTPTLSATAQTASGGESGSQLRVYFDVDVRNSDGTWADSAAGNGDLRPSSGYVGDNTKLTLSWSTLAEGKLYRYRAWTRSYYSGGYLAGPSNGSTTGWCHFKVDPTAPKAPQITIGSPYTECVPTACAPSGGPGVKATFTFAPATGDSNSSYQYRLSASDAWSASIAGSTVNREITPQRSGTYRLYVRAMDSVGRWGAQNVVDFLVAAGEGPVGRWHFDESSGVAVDSATAGGSGRHDATLYGGAARDDRGRRGLMTHDAAGAPLETPITDRGLSLDGTGTYAATDGPTLETRSAYTVSAWTRLGSKDSSGIVLSQDGSHYSAFIMAYEKSLDSWFFGVKEKDEDTGKAYFGVKGKIPATAGVWTHLAGTYNPTTSELRFYVNGELQGTASPPGSWSSNGDFQIGRYLWAGLRYFNFNGSIDEAAVWQRALTAEEIAGEARLMISEEYAGAELVASWDPSTGSGTTVADTISGYERNLTLTGGAALDGEAITLDGVDDAASSSGPLVDDTGSFTVTTAAELDGAKLAAKPVGYTGQVLGQRTADGSAWGFWYEMTSKEIVLDDEGEEKTVPAGKWHFGRLADDGTFNSVVSDEVAALDSPVRVTGIFDAQSGTISLHLGHNQNGEVRAFTAQVGAGDFAIGKGFTGGTWQHYLPGRITDVRIWAGAMASDAQIETTVGD